MVVRFFPNLVTNTSGCQHQAARQRVNALKNSMYFAAVFIITLAHELVLVLAPPGYRTRTVQYTQILKYIPRHVLVTKPRHVLVIVRQRVL